MDIPHEMQIGELAQICQTTTRTLRYYEDVGLIEPIRRLDGGFRVYDGRTIQRIRHIQELKELLGWSLEEIRQVIQAEDAIENLRTQYHRSHSPKERLEVLARAAIVVQGEWELVNERMRRLEEMKQALEQKLQRYEQLSRDLKQQIKDQGSV
ncbi:MerR family transcriptional regulator [Sulfobacillus thermosulfidooxidans]|uniref:MerR family transcriptional regulator n=1 Tax=Sulfobacillus thermosulfidooxidans TaxID=28034 RepID=UPI0002E97040|nr:MerR family transcriptional regulator [Sulfobacillus thermosulfidooxidans]